MSEQIERWDPLREMMALRNRIDHLFESMFARPRGEWLATIFDYPALDMYESDGKITIDVPLPGVKPEEVELSISGRTLTIKGERKAREEVKEANYYRREIHYGAFSRAVVLPETVDVTRPKATFENGVLTVSFPTQKAAESKRIEIKPTEAATRHVG